MVKITELKRTRTTDDNVQDEDINEPSTSTGIKRPRRMDKILKDNIEQKSEKPIKRMFNKNIPSPQDTKPLNKEIDVFFDKVFADAAEEFKVLNLQAIVERYTPVVMEFNEFTLPFRASFPDYNGILTNFINNICSLYDIKLKPIYVDVRKYSTNEWGHLYWDFLHYSSILLSAAFASKRILNLLNFSTIVYHIDTILPCPKCQAHYQAIKNTDRVKDVIKSIAFGSLIYGVYRFHNLISDNINNSADYVGLPKKRLFTLSEFANKYNCIDIQDEHFKKSETYINPYVDWQPTLHVQLTTILSTYLVEPYARTSNLIKNKFYKSNEQFKGVDLKIADMDLKLFDNKEIVVSMLNEKQLKVCLLRGLCNMFQDTPWTEEQLKLNLPYFAAIQYMYQTYPKLIYDVVKTSFDEDPDDKMLRDALLTKLEPLLPYKKDKR
jgi:hypothetical protein